MIINLIIDSAIFDCRKKLMRKMKMGFRIKNSADNKYQRYERVSKSEVVQSIFQMISQSVCLSPIYFLFLQFANQLFSNEKDGQLLLFFPIVDAKKVIIVLNTHFLFIAVQVLVSELILFEEKSFLERKEERKELIQLLQSFVCLLNPIVFLQDS
ncbi:hypothetical protein ABPG74_014885 [Tetrahymena malaccensis]